MIHRPSRIFLLVSFAVILYTLHRLSRSSKVPTLHPSHSDTRPYLPSRIEDEPEDAPLRPFRVQPLQDKAQEVKTAKAADTQRRHPLFSTAQEVDSDKVSVDKTGHWVFNPDELQEHPVAVLIERGKQQAKQVEERIENVRSASDARKDYEREFGMKPPKGIDHWYKFASSVGAVAAPSVFPMVHLPFRQYLSLSGAEVRKRIEEGTKENEFMYTIALVPNGKGDIGTYVDDGDDWYAGDYNNVGRGRAKIGGGKAWSWRCNNTLSLLLPMLHHLPDEVFKHQPPLTLLFNMHDGPRSVYSHSAQTRGEYLGMNNKVWPEAQLKGVEMRLKQQNGWKWSCPEDSPLVRQSSDVVLNDEVDKEAPPKSFVADFYQSVDVCYNPDLRNLHLITQPEHHVSYKQLLPSIALCRTLRNSDITGVPLDSVFVSVKDVPWEAKTSPKLFWRGSPTGPWVRKGSEWRSGPRERLVALGRNDTGETISLVVDRGNGKVRNEEWPVDELSDKWMDTAFAGRPLNCDREDGSCNDLLEEYRFAPFVSKDQQLTYKYVADIDGNGWSSRFRRLLLGNNVIFKSSMYPEWFQDILIPWYHYVPVRLDYSDVYDILSFFEGPPDDPSKNHDDLAEMIAANGRDFVKNRWRVEDMQSFTFLLILEYWRMFSDDRIAHSA